VPSGVPHLSLTPTLHGAGGYFYAAFMPRQTVLIMSLLDAPYVEHMAIRTGTSEGRRPHSAGLWSRPNKSERMSYWRWLLFAAMARLELTEGRYLRIPNAKAIPRDVIVDVYPDGDPSTLGNASYARLTALINRKRRKR
jgi:hypothetical protein